MPTQEAKAHRVGEWASLRNTSPEIAEAIFEVAHYDEKLAEKIWEEGSDEVLIKAFEKQTKIRSFGVNRLSNVKRLALRLPANTGSFSLFSRLIQHAVELIYRAKPSASIGHPFSSSVTRCAGDFSVRTSALRNCSEL